MTKAILPLAKGGSTMLAPVCPCCGLIHAVYFIDPRKGTITDGRLGPGIPAAALELGMKLVSIMDAPLNGDNPTEYMLKAAVLRRHLIDDQRAAIARLWMKENKQDKGGDRKSKAYKSTALRGAVDTGHPTRAETTKLFKVSRRKLDQATYVGRHSPELFEGDHLGPGQAPSGPGLQLPSGVDPGSGLHHGVGGPGLHRGVQDGGAGPGPGDGGAGPGVVTASAGGLRQAPREHHPGEHHGHHHGEHHGEFRPGAGGQGYGQAPGEHHHGENRGHRHGEHHPPAAPPRGGKR